MPSNVKERNQAERSATGMNGGDHVSPQALAPRQLNRDEVTLSADQVLGLLLVEPSYSRVVDLPIAAFEDPVRRTLYRIVIEQYTDREVCDYAAIVERLRT